MNTTEAVGIFHAVDDFEAAVDDLLSQGFNRHDLSLLATEDAVRQKLGNHYVSVKELEDRTHVPTTAYIARESLGLAQGTIIGALMYVPALLSASAVVASGGALAAAISAGVISGGVGGSLGTILAWFLGQKQSEHLEEQLQQGGLLLWVRTKDEQHEKRALAIMTGHKATDVHLHTLPSIMAGTSSPPTVEAYEVKQAHSSM